MTEWDPSKSSVASDSEGQFDAVCANLAQRPRRTLLGELYEQSPGGVSTDRLAETLEESAGEGSRESNEGDQIEIALYHNHLPKLEDAGLVSRGGADSVVLGDHSAFEDTGIVEVITGEADATPAALDALFEGLAHSRRRLVLDVLSHQLHPIHVETLAREVRARELGVTEQDVSAKQAERTAVSFYHSHLPKLADAGLLSWDRADDIVAYEGHAALQIPWIHSTYEPAFRARLTDESSPREIETIEGREAVVSYGQSVFDRADEELFCLITDTDLLEAGCLSRLREASRRGVTIYLGTRDPAAREYVQENVPEVTLWEPTTDWLNLPAEGSTVGRLVLSDRNAVLIGTLKEPLDDGVPEEKAIVGEGPDNAMVVMIRQMIQPHLDQIESESNDGEAELPF